jgi:protein-tyrosine-phosphatase
MTNEPKKILFVCTGNIGRSPMAQFLAERLAREAGLPVRADSAGVEAALGHDVEPGARRALAARGIKAPKRLARQLDETMCAGADRIYALTRAHRDFIVANFPAHAAKVAVLREAAGLPDADVKDPYGESDGVYEQCVANIEEALKILIRRNSHAENPR